MPHTPESTSANSRNQLGRRFRRSHAFFVAVEAYDDVNSLATPVKDVELLAEALRHEAHDYEVHAPLVNPTKAELEAFIREQLPKEVEEEDRVLLYFACHGIAIDEDDVAVPRGFLLPRDARGDDESTFVSMDFLNHHLLALPCRHFLLILDCCFAGSFQWAGSQKRSLDFRRLPKQVYRQRYEVFVKEPAWQVITSAAYNQQALDVVSNHALGLREEGKSEHSPFALALAEALREGAGDLVPKGGDGLMTVAEVFTYLQERLTRIQSAHAQKPALFTLPRHKQGEYLFLNPKKRLYLADYEDDENPYRGLQSYELADQDAFYGREKAVQELRRKLDATIFLVVTGASGSGKSSVIKAGLIPKLAEEGWVYQIIRPGPGPLSSLEEGLKELREKKEKEQSPGILFIDQFEEVMTQCSQREAREQFYRRFLEILEAQEDFDKAIVAIRADFDPLFDQSPLHEVWKAARYPLPTLSAKELEEIIVQPAYERCINIEEGLVEELVQSVENKPGGLPLLSFTLTELYNRFVSQWAGGQTERSLAREDYETIGRVDGSLRAKADELFSQLDEAHRRSMQKIMLRMVSLEGGEPAGRRVYQRNLHYPDPQENQRIEKVLQQLVDAKLVIGDSDDKGVFYEPMHDALLRAWGKLFDWIEEAGRDKLLVLNKLNDSVSEYKENQNKKDLWNRNPRLPAVREGRHIWLNSDEMEFVNRSERVRIRGRNIAIGVTVMIIAVLAGLTIWARSNQLKAEKAQAGQTEQFIESSINRAISLKNEGKYGDAVTVMRDARQLPGVSSSRMDSLIQSWEPVQRIMDEADTLWAEGQLREAIATYAEAAKILPDDQRIKDKMDQAGAELNAKFEDLRSKGVGFMNYGEPGFAIERFEAALKLKENGEVRNLLQECKAMLK